MTSGNIRSGNTKKRKNNTNALEKLDPASEKSPIDQAREDWLLAFERFAYATDDQMIEMAIFDMEAAKRRYVFLLKTPAW